MQKGKMVSLGRVSLALIAVFGSSLAFGATQSEKVQKAMILLQAKLSKMGVAKIEGTEAVAGKMVPALFFGSSKINNNFTVVDEVKTEVGGTATLFVKDGDEFIRVSTNVLKDDGNRAILTPLAKNDAYKAITAGKDFFGEFDILGKPYDTGYSPVKDASGKIIGIYYVGYRKKN